jgi:hypothetical protein
MAELVELRMVRSCRGRCTEADFASSARRVQVFHEAPLLPTPLCNATIPTLPLFEMAESACSPFCYVLHYLLFIKFMSAFYHVCVTGQLL